MNSSVGGISLSDMIKIINNIGFGAMYTKPGFIYQDENGNIKLKFDMDPNPPLT